MPLYGHAVEQACRVDDGMWTEKERERDGMRERRDTGFFLFGTVLERGVTSLFLASEREMQIEREWRGRRVREGM